MNPMYEIAERTRDIIADQLARRDQHSAARLVRTFDPEQRDFDEPKFTQEHADQFNRELDEKRFMRAVLRMAQEINETADRQAQATTEKEQVRHGARLDQLVEFFNIACGIAPGEGGKFLKHWRQKAREVLIADMEK